MSEPFVTERAGRRKLMQQLNYTFADEHLLAQALTHRSASPRNNERLEFLGDGILNFVIAAALYQQYPKENEGDLSRQRAALVKEVTLAEIAQELNLSDLLILGPGEKRNGSARRASILADAVEAIFGAIYTESGFAATQTVILSLFERRLANLPTAAKLKDPKTRLQEWLQARGRQLPNYILVKRTGADHNQHFVSQCQLPDEDIVTRGEGRGRRRSEQDAAAHMLDYLMENIND